jgi:hypothetical protein
MKRALLSILVAAGLAGIGSGCTDPVRDDAIDALGDEEGEPGPEHRPGQPCLLCHSEGGPASDKAFALAGTVYESDEPGAKGKAEVFVGFKDARGGSPKSPIQTGPSGNFYVPIDEWPDMSFPVRVGLYKGNVSEGAPDAIMKSLINREGSCNYCHKPNIDPKDLPKDKDEKKKALQKTTESAGQIFLK